MLNTSHLPLWKLIFAGVFDSLLWFAQSCCILVFFLSPAFVFFSCPPGFVFSKDASDFLVMILFTLHDLSGVGFSRTWQEVSLTHSRHYGKTAHLQLSLCIIRPCLYVQVHTLNLGFLHPLVTFGKNLHRKGSLNKIIMIFFPLSSICHLYYFLHEFLSSSCMFIYIFLGFPLPCPGDVGVEQHPNPMCLLH